MVVRLVVFCAVEMVLLLALADYTSWQFALLEILVTGLLGLTVVRHVTSHFGRKVMSRLAAQEFPGDTVAHGSLLFIAGVLLTLPGVMGDVVGLLLLIPPVRWLVIAQLKRQYRARAAAFQAQFIHLPPFVETPNAEITLECDHRASDSRETGA